MLLDDLVPLSAGDIASLRAIVRQRRNGRRNQATPPGAARIRKRADEIVALLGEAARELRPRETQELDDFVAGRPAKTCSTPSYPVRMHRGAWPPR